MVNGKWSMVNCQWSMVNGQWSMVNRGKSIILTMEPLVNTIADTALWVAIFRADESERPDAVFHDPFARHLAGKRGEMIADKIEFSRTNSWSFVARTFLFDE